MKEKRPLILKKGGKNRKIKKEGKNCEICKNLSEKFVKIEKMKGKVEKIG